ncbi:NuA4-domain-containing protein, partial [Aureobasidium melanogenum]
MNRITTNVDQKLLRTTKFPPEFNQKVDTTKINIPVIKNWAASELSRILGYEDDVVINLLFDLLEGSKNPDVKSLQIQLTGFLEKDAAPFCKELWNLCLSAQKSDTGIPQQLVEAKKLELIQEKVEQERAIEAARQRREDERIRERELENIRNRDRDRRDRGGRGRGRGGGRDFDSRPPRDYSRSQSPARPSYGLSDHHRNRPLPRETDSYVPTGESSGRRGGRRQRSPSITYGSPGSASPRRTSPPRSRRTARRNTSSERSRSRSAEHRMADNAPASATNTDQPGRPYYESLRNTLKNTLIKKRQLDEQLQALEDNIYKMESSYLEDTNGAGNIVRGFDGWVKGVVVGGDKKSADDRKARVRVRDEDRIFSRSSMSWIRAQDSDMPTSATNTPSHAPTPASSVPPQLASRDSNHATPSSTVSKANSKKKKAADKDDDDDKPAKRLKITYGRE